MDCLEDPLMYMQHHVGMVLEEIVASDEKGVALLSANVKKKRNEECL